MCYWKVKFNNYENWIIEAESNSYLTFISPHYENDSALIFLCTDQAFHPALNEQGPQQTLFLYLFDVLDLIWKSIQGQNC